MFLLFFSVMHLLLKFFLTLLQLLNLLFQSIHFYCQYLLSCDAIFHCLSQQICTLHIFNLFRMDSISNLKLCGMYAIFLIWAVLLALGGYLFMPGGLSLHLLPIFLLLNSILNYQLTDLSLHFIITESLWILTCTKLSHILSSIVAASSQITMID